MKSRTLWILGICLVVLGIGYLLGRNYLGLKWQPRSQTVEPYAQLAIDEVSRLEIHRKDTLYVFEREGGQWKMTEPIVATSDEEALQNLLTALQTISMGDVISTRPEKYETFEVDTTSGIQVRAYIVQDHPVVDLIVGKGAMAAGQMYTRFPPDPKVYLVKGISRPMLDRDRDRWRNRYIMKVDMELIGKVRAYDGTKLLWELDNVDGTWMIDTLEADQALVRNMITSLARLRASDFQEEDEPFVPQSSLEVTFYDGSVDTIFVGKGKDKRYPVRRTGDGTTYILVEWMVDRILKDKNDLLPPED
jgi:hypothetical protein